MKGFWWLGAGPQEPLRPLGNRLPKRRGRTKAGIRPPREKHRVVNGSQFRRIKTLDEILKKLFGHLPNGAQPMITDEDEEDQTACFITDDAQAKRKKARKR